MYLKVNASDENAIKLYEMYISLIELSINFMFNKIIFFIQIF